MICNDAKRMLELRRQFAQDDADGKLSTPVATALIDAIDLIRWNHHDLSPVCDCWQEARFKADKAAAA